MKTIHKFQLEVTDTQLIEMPIGAKILCVQNQNETPCLWAEVNTGIAKEFRRFSVYGTGHELRYPDHTDHAYIGTFQMNAGRLVLHVYENKLPF